MATLRIYFSGNWHDSSSSCPWALCDESGAMLQSGTGTLAALPKGHECIAIIAPDRVLFAGSRLPQGSRRRWQAALPFLAEEHTLSDPEDNHVVPGPADADGRMMLAVIDKHWFGRIIEACRAANLSVRHAVPETLLPALPPATWPLIWDGSSGFLRTGSANGTALDRGNMNDIPLALRLRLNSANTAPGKIEVRFPQHVPADQRILPEWAGLTPEISRGDDWDWRKAPIPADTLDLLWGNFSARPKIGELWPKLRPAVLILLAAFAVETLGSNVEWLMLAQEKKALTHDMERSFHSAFGENSMLVDAPLQMQRNLAQLRHSVGMPDHGDFLPLLDMAAPALASLPAGSVRGMHYESGRLDMDIKLGHGGDFKGLRERLEKSGLAVQPGEINDVGDGAESRLTLLQGSIQ